MRIGIVSDIHCNLAGLNAALELMGPVDELLCAGDAIFEYRFNNEVIAALKERGARMVLGNHELVFLGPAGVRAREAASVSQELAGFVAEQPLILDTKVGGKRLVMVHGSPIAPHDRYVFPGTRELEELRDIEADFVVLGHTHCQMVERVGRVLVVNPGSAGDARDPRNGGLLSCAVLDTASKEVTIDNYAVD